MINPKLIFKYIKLLIKYSNKLKDIIIFDLKKEKDERKGKKKESKRRKEKSKKVELIYRYEIHDEDYFDVLK